MKQTLKLSALIFIIFLVFSCKRESLTIIEIDENWQFTEAGKQDGFQANVPGCVQSDLFNNNKINDPFFGDNEQKLQWISQSAWEYKTTFKVDKEFLEKEHVELVFEGIDTYADIFLNGSKLLKANNMFREWAVDCKPLLIEGMNILEINFTPSEKIDSIRAAQQNISLPDNRAYTRKAPYQSGWDWGPRFVTMGIWKPVYLRSWKDARIENIQIKQDSIVNDTAWITTIFEIESSIAQDCFLSIIDEATPDLVNKVRVRLEKGMNLFPVKFHIAKPDLWWTKDIGAQHLYDFGFLVQTNHSIDKKYKKLGVRTIELVQQSDSVGASFYFKLNGVPVFMKGANYIPQDNFPANVNPDKYKKLIQSAVDANMNMLRVWGGGIYEDDLFYDLCDKNGILVWQDFMFACNLYPGNDGFMGNVKQEAIEQVKRLRNHPSLALWCGNNEIDEAWHNWGWQKSMGYSAEDSTELWNNYLDLFEELLPKIVDSLSNQTAYISSSPKYGWGRDESLKHGDMHYWGVWWGEEPFEMYENKVGRFMSEYGFQGFPDMKTLRSCLDSTDLSLGSKALLNHQKHPRGMELIQTYMEREYLVPESFEDYNYVSQLLQAYGIKKAIEAHRRAKPVCMGTLYWQLNDSWPGISWSGIDYYGRWKALHYFVKKAYGKTLISFEENDGSLKVFIVSDKLKNINGELELSILDFDGEEYWSEKQIVEVPANSSSVYFEKEINRFSKNDHLLSAKLVLDGKTIAENIYYFTSPKDLRIIEPSIQQEITKTENGYRLILKTDKLAKNVFLSVDGDGFFSDNYFDLLPGESKEIRFVPEGEIVGFEKELKVITLFDTFGE
ncbi:MAG: glycoside hydrolase family 2 protein [Bacteroidetes bacterium]|nr:MAG: glycoside hydrolase family 2 protein [Bacteroidota bacterium]